MCVSARLDDFGRPPPSPKLVSNLTTISFDQFPPELVTALNMTTLFGPTPPTFLNSSVACKLEMPIPADGSIIPGAYRPAFYFAANDTESSQRIDYTTDINITANCVRYHTSFCCRNP
jgi:hypothetical protein